MTHFSHLLIFAFTIITTTSSMDLHYLDACTAILKGNRWINAGGQEPWGDFAEWENTNPASTVT